MAPTFMPDMLQLAAFQEQTCIPAQAPGPGVHVEIWSRCTCFLYQGGEGPGTVCWRVLTVRS